MSWVGGWIGDDPQICPQRLAKFGYQVVRLLKKDSRLKSLGFHSNSPFGENKEKTRPKKKMQLLMSPVTHKEKNARSKKEKKLQSSSSALKILVHNVD